jgi:hypothetical protein
MQKPAVVSDSSEQPDLSRYVHDGHGLAGRKQVFGDAAGRKSVNPSMTLAVSINISSRCRISFTLRLKTVRCVTHGSIPTDDVPRPNPAMRCYSTRTLVLVDQGILQARAMRGRSGCPRPRRS